MKKPTVAGNDLYQVGNDYPQAPASAYFVTSSYADGIYTEVNPDLIMSADSIDGFDDSFFDLKNPEGLNKRILNVLPQSAWAETDPSGLNAYHSEDYATAELTGFPSEE
jgi:hypothetical protein